MNDTRFQRPLPVDWFRLLADLAYAGHSNAFVARACEIPSSTLQYLKEGGCPTHDNGQALVAFYQHCLSRPIPIKKQEIAANECA